MLRYIFVMKVTTVFMWGLGLKHFGMQWGSGFDGWNYLLMDGGGSSIPPILDSPGKHKLTGMDRQTEKGVCHILFLAAN